MRPSPPALSIPVQGLHLRYVWDGKAQAFTHVLEVFEHRVALHPLHRHAAQVLRAVAVNDHEAGLKGSGLGGGSEWC
ncbi:hypothetical protein C1H69_19445 [Billgrantia endophytica]|uniref:Uncharacterized protein n=1 Tax=Billgrantia endophytica TaxID=2033802 RepID=A0A2N7TXA7_9GAMM|nr:hypothetical protein C1H69_19445 [Halomonas endophytica]